MRKIYGKKWIVVVLIFMSMFLFMVSCAKKQVQSTDTIDADKARLEADRLAEQERARLAEEERLRKEREAREMAEREATGSAQHAFINVDVLFAFDSSELSSEAQEILGNKVTYLNEHSDIAVVIEGHCDERGTTEYNLALGDRRAAKVKRYLVDKGISASRMQTVSYGEERPLDASKGEDAYEKNRRAHFVIK
ncbi:MAG: peptidoglycan-associated lipoprotein Pal [Desulfobacterales bacterium]|nr:peptidoglycan-associated lipoprotein Pal [Desulfobacterales bacterium]